MKAFFISTLFLFFFLPGFSQSPDTLLISNFPCCISGIEWDDQEERLFLVSDLSNKVYVATVDLNNMISKVVDSISISNSPHEIGLESIRKAGNTFYFAYEKDENSHSGRTATTFISKGIFKNGVITIVKNIEINNLPDNKGIEGLTIADEGKSIWVSHETMAKPRNGVDSVKLIQLDTNLSLQSFRWYALPKLSFFTGNISAYNDYGITEILNIKDSLYILERSYGKLNSSPELFINLVKTSISDLKKKILLYSFKAIPSRANYVDNYEGMCWLNKANKLLIISDDNRNMKHQRTILLILNP